MASIKILSIILVICWLRKISGDEISVDLSESKSSSANVDEKKTKFDMSKFSSKRDGTIKEKALHVDFMKELIELEPDNQQAKIDVAWARLFGTFLPQNWTFAHDSFTQLSNVGSVEGQVGLGFMYAAGISVDSSQAKSLVYYTFAALGGNHWAQMVLGYRYASGITVEESCEMALTYYKKAADYVKDNVKVGGGAAISRVHLMDEFEGNPGSAANQGLASQLDDDLINYYQLLAYKGDAHAQLGLGQLHMHGGRGFDVNIPSAKYYFNLAANLGNPIAMASLGKIILDEESPDYEAALEYFRKSSSKNNREGQYGLGLMYLNGWGVPKNLKEAHDLFKKSADQGLGEAQTQLGLMHESGKGAPQDVRAAMKFFRLASQSGSLVALHHLASMHANGVGTMRSCPIAMELYKNVAERGSWAKMFMEAYHFVKHGKKRAAMLIYMLLAEMGYETAESNAAWLLDEGHGDDVFGKDEAFQRALIYWLRSANQGYVGARLKLGDYYFYGKGTDIDYAVAARHYKQAGEQMNPQAYFNLAYMHEHALGIQADLHLAKRYVGDFKSVRSLCTRWLAVIHSFEKNEGGLNYFNVTYGRILRGQRTVTK